jgi:hypothetical protein
MLPVPASIFVVVLIGPSWWSCSQYLKLLYSVVCCCFALTAVVTSCFSLFLVAVVISSPGFIRAVEGTAKLAHTCHVGRFHQSVRNYMDQEIAHYDQQPTGRCQNYARKIYPTACGTFLRTRRNKKYAPTRVPTCRLYLDILDMRLFLDFF